MKRWGLFLLVILLTLLWVPSLEAQEGVSVSPRQLSVAARRGQTETRLLLLRTVEPLNDLRIIPLDLNAAKGDIVLPAEIIQIAPPATTIAANGLLTVPVTFNLTNAPSGQFTGELLISYTGQSFTVPVTVAVKDQPWLPLAALVVGVALGIGVSTYRAQGRPRDEVLVRLGQIRTQMKADKDLEEKGKPFYTRLDAHLVDVEVALEAHQWEKAQEAVRTAETLWVRWRRARPDWLEQIAYYTQLNEKLAGLGEVFYINEIKDKARNAYLDMPNLNEPDGFRERLEPLTRQVNNFIALQERITALKSMTSGTPLALKLQQRLHMLSPDDEAGYQNLHNEVETTLQKVQTAQLEKKIAQLTELSTKLPPDQVQAWSNTVRDLQTRLTALAPDDPSAYLTLESDVETALRQLEGLAPSGEVTFRGAQGTTYDAKGIPQPESWLPHPPDTHVEIIAEKIAGAGRRLQWFTWLTYAVAVIFLALAGFVELYGARPDFGVNGIGDYFTLLAWGFGAEATRASIADMVQGWSLAAEK